MLIGCSTAGSGVNSGNATDAAGGATEGAGVGSLCTVGVGAAVGSGTGGSGASTWGATSAGGVGRAVVSGTSTVAAEAAPLAKEGMGSTWPATSRAASSSLFMFTRASMDPSMLLSIDWRRLM